MTNMYCVTYTTEQKILNATHITTGCGVFVARSEAEAVGMAYGEVLANNPIEDGYRNHTVRAYIIDDNMIKRYANEKFNN